MPQTIQKGMSLDASFFVERFSYGHTILLA